MYAVFLVVLIMYFKDASIQAKEPWFLSAKLAMLTKIWAWWVHNYVITDDRHGYTTEENHCRKQTFRVPSWKCDIANSTN